MYSYRFWKPEHKETGISTPIGSAKNIVSSSKLLRKFKVGAIIVARAWLTDGDL